MKQYNYRFSPPYGDGIALFAQLKQTGMFSPPCGDCTKIVNAIEKAMTLSSPYGDCTKSCAIWLDGRLFSPPYGDGTINISQNTEKLKSRMTGKYSLYYNDVFLR